MTEREAQFKRRLEAFSDIVFGLSLSELALQLGIPATPRGLIDDPLRYVIFFGSFALVCSLWIGHHRMFRTFVPSYTTVGLNFAYLAFTVLMPFGMQALLKFPESPVGFGVYAICYAATMGTLCILQIIGMRDQASRLDAEERLDLFGRIVRSGSVFLLLLVGLAALPRIGTAQAGFILFLMIPLTIYTRRGIHRVPDSFMRLLRIPSFDYARLSNAQPNSAQDDTASGTRSSST